MEFSNLKNLDLLSVGIAVAAMAILGFAVYLNNRKSITTKTFLIFSLVSALWGIVNYLNYQIESSFFILWTIRLVMFFAIWQAFFLFQLIYVFPKEEIRLSKKYKYILIPLVVAVSILTLSPLVFSDVIKSSSVGQVSKPISEPGIIIFGVVAVGLVIGGIIILFRKILTSKGIERTQLKFILSGVFLMFLLIIIFNFISPAFLQNVRYVPLGALFILPFVLFTSYAILKHGLLNVKIITTEILTFILAVVALLEVVLANDITTIIFRSGVFILILSFGIMLIQSVRREIEQKEKIQELSQYKSDLISIVAHQIKNPLVAIRNYAALVQGNVITKPEMISEVFLKIKSSANKLVDLLNNLLDLGHIEDGRMHYEFDDIEMNKSMKEIIDDFKFAADQKKIQLIFEPAPQEVHIDGDIYKLSQVFRNLIDNALKYTPQGWIKTTIAVNNNPKLTTTNSKGVSNVSQNIVRVTFSDSGMGMTKEILAKLFNRFIRGVEEKQVLGSGLGLFISRQIVEDHKGKVWAESDGPGKGSRFIVELPVKEKVNV